MKAKQEEKIISAQLQEHSELVQLYIHEDNLAWQLNLAFLATNGAIFTGFYSLGAFESTKFPQLGIFVLVLASIVLNLIAFFVSFRNEIYLDARLQRCYLIEDQLKDKGIIIQTLISSERTIEKGMVIHGGDTRKLHWWEKIEILRYRYAAFFVVIFWIACLVWLAIGRPGL